MKRFRMIESAHDATSMVGCAVKNVYPANDGVGTGIFIECVDGQGNELEFLVDEDGAFHLYESIKAKCPKCGNTQNIGGSARYCMICGNEL